MKGRSRGTAGRSVAAKLPSGTSGNVGVALVMVLFAFFCNGQNVVCLFDTCEKVMLCGMNAVTVLCSTTAHQMPPALFAAATYS